MCFLDIMLPVVEGCCYLKGVIKIEPSFPSSWNPITLLCFCCSYNPKGFMIMTYV